MSTRARSSGGGGVVTAVRIDLQRLHAAWMELLFPRQRQGHSVMGTWKPETTSQRVAYNAWALLGFLGLFVLYPLAVVGLGTRFYAAKLDSTRTRLGIAGVTAIAVLAWGALTVLARLQLSPDAFLAVAAASLVAVAATALAALFTKVGGRSSSVLLGYPFAVTAFLLPPVVAAIVTPSLEATILDPSYALAVWILNNLLFVADINTFLRSNFVLDGPAYAGMWLGISFPLGWFLGGLIALADVVRPK